MCKQPDHPAGRRGRERASALRFRAPNSPELSELFSTLNLQRLSANPVPKREPRGKARILSGMKGVPAASALQGPQKDPAGLRVPGAGSWQTRHSAPRPGPHSPWQTSLRTEVCCPGHLCRRSWWKSPPFLGFFTVPEPLQAEPALPPGVPGLRLAAPPVTERSSPQPREAGVPAAGWALRPAGRGRSARASLPSSS